MVRGFVDEQSASVAFVPVPAAEVICSVAGVECPFEMDGVDFSDDSFACLV